MDCFLSLRLNPIQEQTLLFLFSRYVQNPTTSHHLHSYTLSPNHHHLLPGGNSLLTHVLAFCPCPPMVYSRHSHQSNHSFPNTIPRFTILQWLLISQSKSSSPHHGLQNCTRLSSLLSPSDPICCYCLLCSLVLATLVSPLFFQHIRLPPTSGPLHLYLEHSPPRFPRGSLPHFLQVFTQMSPSQWVLFCFKTGLCIPTSFTHSP